ncbi:PhzF family phenazine biosynthesis protein [Sphingomonas oleivorans]|uniref:PhzF family phenazine biosynthesis protein n=1 Tax=Sphingomonas oleivorans TaxID=1735121 RepID=A0A2T5G0T9_9SPHN|nr:PhzF family phenazine biosynthesis protein [Sphingomonas oleivorans]PTQ12775.1 PhzF family phenazine biosynthesis protein [Sphingomonas oleivorans]
MTELRFVQVDAFADRPFAGNPAAVMPLDRWLDDDLLQAIAGENNLAETAFLVPTTGGNADYELRWFTPTTEVALCGHATLASGHVMLGDLPQRDAIHFRTSKAGVLTVARAGKGYALDLPAWAPSPRPLPDAVAAVGGRPLETLWREGYSVLVYASEAEVRALAPDFAALRSQGDILYIATAPGRDTAIVSRAFAPGAGIDEDPVTGSAHSVIVPYWAERLGRESFTAFQASRRGGRLSCRLAGDRVVLGGSCVTVIEGRFRL